MALTKVKASNITLTTAAANSNDTTPATTQYVTTAINNLIDGAPATLNTLDEIAAALNDDAALNTTLTNAIAAKAPLAGPTFTGDVDIDGSDDVRLRFLRGSTFKGGIQVPTSTGDMISGAAIDDLAIRSQANMLFSAGGNTERMRIDSTGNVGIGTDSPNANLEITQSGNNVGLLVAGGGYNYTAKFESVDAEANIIIEDSNSTNDGNMIGVATNDMYFITDTAERMRIDSSGNVGIGTSAIMQDFGDGRTTLALKGTGIADYSTLQLGNYGTSSNDQIHGLINFYDGTTSVSRIQSVRASNTSDAHLAFYTAPSSGGITERMRIDSSGNVGIGNSSYGASLGQLRVINDAASAPASLSLFGYNNISDDAEFAKIDFASQISGTGGNPTAKIAANIEGINERAAHLTFHTHNDGGSLQERMRIDASGRVTMPYQPGFFARGNTSQWLQGFGSSWNTIVAGIAHANGTTIGVNLTEGGTGALNGYDAGSDFNTSNGRFTAPIDGKYLIHGSLYAAKIGTNGNDYMHFLVYVNGQQINQMYTMGGHKQAYAVDFSLNLSTVLRLDANDYVEWKIYTTSTNMRIYGDHMCIGAHMIS